MHIEIRSLPAPQESQVQIQTANRDNSPIFAQTLKRKSASDEQADRANKDSKLVAKPDEALDGATTTDDLPVVNAMTVDSTNVPVNPLTLGDFGIGLPTNAVESADVALTSGTDVSQEHLAAAATTTDTAATALALHTQTPSRTRRAAR